jgi:hypothetical protein
MARNSRNWCTASRMVKSLASNTSMHDLKNHDHSFAFLPLIRQIAAPVLPSQFRLDAAYCHSIGYKGITASVAPIGSVRIC